MIPVELQSWPQWVAWRWVQRPDGTWTKPPCGIRNGRYARVDAPETWASYEAVAQAVAAGRDLAGADPGRRDPGTRKEGAQPPGRYDGLGFVLTADDPFVGVDLDHCRDAQSGVLTAEAQAIVTGLDTYTEGSPSGTGLHLIARGSLPLAGCKRGPLEVYASGRCLTMTGDALPGTPATIEERTEALARLVEQIGADRPAGVSPLLSVSPDRAVPDMRQAALSPTDLALIGKAHAARNGPKFARLWAGQWRDLGLPSQSEADLALVSMLLFRTGGDAAHADRLFRASGLMRPKWDERARAATYGERTLAYAQSRSWWGRS